MADLAIGSCKNKMDIKGYIVYSGSRRNLIRYNSHQAKIDCAKLWLCANIAWLEVFAHEKPACALYM